MRVFEAGRGVDVRSVTNISPGWRRTRSKVHTVRRLRMGNSSTELRYGVHRSLHSGPIDFLHASRPDGSPSLARRYHYTFTLPTRPLRGNLRLEPKHVTYQYALV